MSAMSASRLAILTLLCICVVKCEKYSPIRIEIETNDGGLPPKIFKADELAKFDGTDPDQPIYLAIKGVVFDVTSGKQFYNKKSDYNALCGKDASRAHALWSLKEEDLTHDLTGLEDQQLKGLDEVYEKTYKVKYPVVGYMDYLLKQQEDDIKARFTNEEL